MDIGKKIRKIRLLKGLSQENIAEILCVDYTNYGRIERGQAKNISIEKLEKIASAFNMGLIDFLLYDENTQDVKILNNDKLITPASQGADYLLKEIEYLKEINKELKEKAELYKKLYEENKK